MAILAFVLVAAGLRGCDLKGSRETARKIEAGNRLARIGKELSRRLKDGESGTLKEIVSRISDAKDLVLSSPQDARLDSGELIFLSEKQPPQSDDFYLAYVYHRKEDRIAVYFLMPEVRVRNLDGLQLSRFQEWLKRLDGPEDSIGGKIETLSSDVNP